jgi:general secretion pathway protein N
VDLEGRLALDMQDMASRLSPVRPLGTYRLYMDWHGQRADVRLETLHGPMLLSGGGQVENGHFRFSGRAEAAPGDEERLANLLNLLGQRRIENGKPFIALEFKQ